MGHQMKGVTEEYAQFSPDYLGEGRKVIDAYFAELGVSFAWHADVSDPKGGKKIIMFSKGRMVDPTGIEPVTPTMST